MSRAYRPCQDPRRGAAGAAVLASIDYNDAVDQRPRRRLRSASVQLGALTALALALSGCNMTSDDDDDDCALGPVGGGDTVALAMRVTAPAAGRTAGEPTTAALPERGGFGTHLASCGG
ncbi:hypothetical protein AB0B39_20385 [Micromonospora sp. NPDC049114]|uniref:hypothetical protein n=1 Tax=unclassified Micromonospora TaxID=2617518 RepID=UPI001F1EDE98|nr:hypothetical protein [Micromonospora sp. MH99]